MEKTKHQQEIKNSRKGGFGGSDAAMFLRIAKRGSLDQLSRTDAIRIAVAMGLREYQSIEPTAAMQLGHDFEDYYESTPFVEVKNLEREKKLEGSAMYQPKNFAIFAHADFYDNKNAEVYELKCSTATDTEVAARNMAQIQWYYILGAKAVTLVHCTPQETDFFEGDEKRFEDVSEVVLWDDRSIIDLLINGIQILDEAISEGWKPDIADTMTEGELDTDILAKLHTLQANKEMIDMLTTKGEKLKAEILAYMDEKGIAVVDGEDYTLTKVGATETRSFDSAKFFKAHPELASEKEQFQKVSQRKAYVTLKAKK